MTTKKTRRNYKDAKGNNLPGVTSVLQLLHKPALLGWAARIAAEATARAILDGGIHRDGAVEIGRKAHIGKRDHAADLGTRAHDLVEQHYTSGPPIVDVSDADNAKVHTCYRRVVDHLEGTSTRVCASEAALVDTVQGFGGTLDFVLERDGVLFIGDLKTGKAVYDEVVLQLAAYRWLWQLHHPTKPILGGGLVIHSPIDGECKEIAVSTEQLDSGQHVFGALVEVYHHMGKCKLVQS